MIDAYKYNRKHLKLIKDFTRNAYFETQNVKEFTKEIDRIINFFRTEEEKAFCLSVIIFSANIIPYKQIPGDPVKISTDEYKNLLLAHKDKSDLILYLVSLPFFDWNEAASQLLQVLDDNVDNKKLRVALLSLFMTAKIKEETDS